MNNKNHSDLSDKIMAQIEKDKIKMRPQFWFALGTVLLISGTIGLVLMVSFTINLIVFFFCHHEPFSDLWLGRVGLWPIITHFPWWALGSSLIGTVGGYYALRNIDPFYKINYIYLILGLIVFIVLLILILEIKTVDQSLRNTPLKKAYPLKIMDMDTTHGRIVEIDFEKQLMRIETHPFIFEQVTWDDKSALDDFNCIKPDCWVNAAGVYQNPNLFFARAIVN